MAKNLVNRDLVQMTDPFGELPPAERRKVLRAVGVKAREAFDKLVGEVDGKLKPVEPIHCMCLGAYYMLFSVAKPGASESDAFGQHKAELLQALLLKHPEDFYEGVVGTPEHVQAGLDLAKGLMDEKGNSTFAEIPDENDAIARLRVIQEMRMHTQVMRGEYYPEQLNRMFRPSLQRVEALFTAAYGIGPIVVYDLVQRLAQCIEDRLNAHIKKIRAFINQPTFLGMVAAYKKSFPNVEVDADQFRKTLGGKPDAEIHEQAKYLLLGHSDLRITDIFSITDEEIVAELQKIDAKADVDAAKAIIRKLSMSLGDAAEKSVEHILLDNPVWAKPFVNHDGKFILPLPTTFTSYCLDIFRGLAEINAELKAAYEDTRAQWLEDMAAELLKEALPLAKVWRSVKWKDKATGKEFENDLVLLVDRWLLLFEAKSGQVTDSARRGSYDRLKREIKKLMVDPSDQSRRLKEFLTGDRKLHKLASKNGPCEIDSSKLDGVIRINVTNESIGNLNSRGESLVEAGLLPKGTDLAPTMSLSSLDLVLQLIGTQNAILHYLSRRKAFEANAMYMADELDLTAFYLDNGFNIGEAELDGTMLMIFGISNDLDRELASRKRKFGKQNGRAVSAYWERFLNVLEKNGNDGWLSLAMRLRNVSADDQRTFEKRIRKAVDRFKKDGPIFGKVILNPRARYEGILLVVTEGRSKAEVEKEVRDAFQQMVGEKIQHYNLDKASPKPYFHRHRSDLSWPTFSRTRSFRTKPKPAIGLKRGSGRTVASALIAVAPIRTRSRSSTARLIARVCISATKLSAANSSP